MISIEKDSRKNSFEPLPFSAKIAQRQETLFKWGLSHTCNFFRFCYDSYFQEHQLDSFLLEFFNNPQVQHSFKVINSNGNSTMLGNVEKITFNQLSTNVTDMSFFNRLFDSNVVRESGDIIQCFDEYLDDGVILSNELQKMLLMEASESYDLFNQQERKEFLFHIFKRLVLGGGLCQYDDHVADYLEASKSIYKDLVTVKKLDNTIQVVSKVYEIHGMKTDLNYLFPNDHPFNFLYLAIDPVKRHISLWYHAHIGV